MRRFILLLVIGLTSISAFAGDKIIRGQAWVNRINPDLYMAQIERFDVRPSDRLVDDYRVHELSVVEHDGGYITLYGPYQTQEEARWGLSFLPDSVDRSKIVVRQASAYQR